MTLLHLSAKHSFFLFSPSCFLSSFLFPFFLSFFLFCILYFILLFFSLLLFIACACLCLSFLFLSSFSFLSFSFFLGASCLFFFIYSCQHSWYILSCRFAVALQLLFHTALVFISKLFSIVITSLSVCRLNHHLQALILCAGGWTPESRITANCALYGGWRCI